MPPASSRMKRLWSACRPASVSPCIALSAVRENERALIHQVSGSRRLKILVLVHSNIDCRSSERTCHLAISVQRLSARLSAVIDVAAIFGDGRVSRKFQASQASTVVLPGPLHAFIAMRWWSGKAASTSSCHGSGVARSTWRTKLRGFFFQR